MGLGLVVASGVDVELSDELAGGGVDDSDVEVLDEHQDACSGVGSADADVAESAGDAQRDVARCRHGVVAYPVVGVAGPVAAGVAFGRAV